jgi:hypothetical protein
MGLCYGQRSERLSFLTKPHWHTPLKTTMMEMMDEVMD